MSSDQPVVSAQVTLRAASGKEVRGDTAITAASIAEYAPAPDAAAKVRQAFAAAGFEVGSVVGNNFSITAPPDRFERFFHARIKEREGGGLEFAREDMDSLELSGTALPRELARDVTSVTFSPPPDFGPTSYM